MPEETKSDKIFTDGMNFYPPSLKSPAWAKGTIAINVEKFTAFLQNCPNERGWVRIEIKESKKGNVYCELSQWKPNKK